MTTSRLRRLRITLYVVAAFQFVLGTAFLVVPAGTARVLGLPPAPSWTSWLFAMMGARFIGYGVGMLATARDPVGHRMWLDTMIAIQAVDWIATIAYLAAGDVSLHQVAAASFMPAVFVVALLSSRPRRSAVLSAA